MNPIPIIGVSILGIIALHLAYKSGARKADTLFMRRVLHELSELNYKLSEININVDVFSTLFVRHLSDLASKPKTAKPRKTTRLKN